MNFLDRRFLNFSLSVLAIANEPADNPTAGSQYIVGSNPTGAFASASPNQIARYNGSAWSFISPKNGELEVLNLSNGQILSFNGSAWTSVASFSGNSSSDSSDASPLNYVTVVQGVVRSGTKPDNYFGLFLDSQNRIEIPLLDVVQSEYRDNSNGDSFLSLSDNKIYVFDEDSNSFSSYSPLPGQVVFNSDPHDLAFYLCDTYGYFSKIGTSKHIQPVDFFIDAFFYNNTQYAVDEFKEAHSSEGFSFFDYYMNTLYSYSDGVWQEEFFSSNKRFFAPYLNDSLSPRIYEANNAHGNSSSISVYDYDELFNGHVFLNLSDNSLYVFDGTNISKAGGGSASAASDTVLVTEAHSLTAAEVSAKSFSLTHNIAQGQEANTLLFVSGIAQIVGTDFNASGNSISWNNKALDDIDLAAGDSFLIQYIKE